MTETDHLMNGGGNGRAIRVIVNGVMLWTAGGSPDEPLKDIIGSGAVWDDAQQGLNRRTKQTVLPNLTRLINGSIPGDQTDQALKTTIDLFEAYDVHVANDINGDTGNNGSPSINSA